ncbi:SDR family oxidoreductase [Desmospora profundinema]|nr:SDR family oxidoreductase [Desmospora profundinema]
MSIAITGATGQLGGLVIQHLLDKNVPAGQIVAVVRNVEKASALADRGIDVRVGDYHDPASLEKAFAGVSKLHFIPSPDAHDEPLRMVQHAHVIKAARDAKVEHIVYSGIAFAEEITFGPALLHLATEYAIRTTQIPYTFLRSAFYTEVFVTPELSASVEQGAIINNTGNGRVNSVSRSDLALASAAVLTGKGHENQTYNLVSNQPWSFAELAQALSEISGKPVVHQAVSFEDGKDFLMKTGLPEPVALLFSSIYSQISYGETSKTSDDLEKLIGTQTPLKETVKQVLHG